MNQLLQDSLRRATCNFNRWIPAWLVAGLLALSGLALSTASGLAAGYTISIPSGFSLIANHLDTGGNTLQEVLPGVPNGTVIQKYNCNNNYTTNTMVAGVWTPAGTTLKPGEGAYIVNNSGAPFNLTFTGTQIGRAHV